MSVWNISHVIQDGQGFYFYFFKNEEDATRGKLHLKLKFFFDHFIFVAIRTFDINHLISGSAEQITYTLSLSLSHTHTHTHMHAPNLCGARICGPNYI